MSTLFRNLIIPLCVTLLSGIVSSCSEDNIEADSKVYKQELKVLCIGNSFTEGAFSHVPELFALTAPDVRLTLGIAYIPASPLVQHHANLIDDSETLQGKRYYTTGYSYHKSSSDDLRWRDQWNVSITRLLHDEQWDIITFQQGGAVVMKDYDKVYAPFIREILKTAEEKCKYKPQFGWVMIHGCYASDADGLRRSWVKIAEDSKRVMDEENFTILFPYGTAIQNLRENPAIRDASDSVGWTTDSGHLQEGLGVLTATYANTFVLMKIVGKDIPDDMYHILPTFDLDNPLNIPNPQYGLTGIVGINDFNCRQAVEAAVAAVESPYQTISPTPER